MVVFAHGPKPSSLPLTELGLDEPGETRPAGTEAVIFTPVDYPCIRKSTVEALGRADGAVVIAGFEGKRGHPVRVSRAVAAELCSLPDDAQARDVIRLHAAGTLLLETGDPGILNDIDTPQAYNELVSAWGAQR